MGYFDSLKGRVKTELLSGFLVTVIALPLALAFGVAAYGPLGPAYGALGAVAGLVGAGITGFLASLFGGTPTQVTGPTGPMSMVARSTIASLLGAGVIENLPEEQKAAAVLWLFGISVIFGGILQWSLILTKLGNLVKDLPYPVVAGFMNGVSLLIIVNQIRSFLGWDNDTPWEQIFSLDWPIEVFVGLSASLVTTFVLLLLPKISKKIPPTFAGLFLGTLTYYIAGLLLGLPVTDWANNSQIIGPIPSTMPSPKILLDSKGALPLLFNREIWILLLQQTLVLGLLGTIDTLLTSVIADLKSGTRHSSSRELFGQGLGNIISGIFGGLPGAGATVRTLSNIEAGGRTRFSGAFHGLLLLSGLLFLGPVFMVIPLPVLGAILIVIAIKMVDTWSMELTRKRSARGDSMVLWLVTFVTLFSNLIISVVTGLILAGILFVRRQKVLGTRLSFYDGNILRSCVLRSDAQEEVLQKYGDQIQIVKIRGNLFFGTSDDLMGELEKQIKLRQITVLDMEQLSSLDLTGGKMLLDLLHRWKSQGHTLLWGGWNTSSQSGRFLAELGLIEILGTKQVHSTLDKALEDAEDRILDEQGHLSHTLEIPELPHFRSLDSTEIELIIKSFVEKHLADQEILFDQGQDSGDIYFVLEGKVEIFTKDKKKEGLHRIAVYGPGQGLGIMSWMESRPKKSMAMAKGAAKLAWIPKEALEKLLEDHPKLGVHLLKIWGEKLSNRVRRYQTNHLHLN